MLAIAQEGVGADDLGEMSVSLKDLVNPTKAYCKLQELQAKQALEGFLPLSVAHISVCFLDALAIVNFADHQHQRLNQA